MHPHPFGLVSANPTRYPVTLLFLYCLEKTVCFFILLLYQVVGHVEPSTHYSFKRLNNHTRVICVLLTLSECLLKRERVQLVLGCTQIYKISFRLLFSSNKFCLSPFFLTGGTNCLLSFPNLFP